MRKLVRFLSKRVEQIDIRKDAEGGDGRHLSGRFAAFPSAHCTRPDRNRNKSSGDRPLDFTECMRNERCGGNE